MVLSTFPYIDGETVSEITVVDINGKPWFIALDVCKCLDLEQPTRAISTLDEDEKLTLPIVRSGQIRNMNVVNESGLYNLIFKSRKATARQFRKWVTNDVLPQIRQEGGYGKFKMPNFVKRYFKNYNRVDKGYFSVISELFVVLYAKLEHQGYSIPDKGKNGRELRPDVSVGSCFAHWLEKNHPDKAHNFKTYPHTLTDTKDVDARQYPREMKPLFEEYVEDYWIPNKAEKYFKERDEKALEYLTKLLESQKN